MDGRETHRVRVGPFETRHPTLLHLLIVGAAWTTYLFDRVDVVWRIIRDDPSRGMLEHLLFSLSTALIGIGAVLCTRARASMSTSDANSRETVRNFPRAWLLGEWLYAIGLAALLPLWGSILLIFGESIRIVRLARGAPQPADEDHFGRGPDRRWSTALRREFVKWGIFGTMMIFSVCLIDRVADYGILASLLAWALLSVPVQRIRPSW